jgi:TRAP-type C4-dicarboxylate transport system permease small subunit
MFKAFLLGMIAAYLVIWFGYPLYSNIFPGGGVAETHLKPIYMGMVMLSGLIVSCSYVVYHLLKEELMEMVKEIKSDKKTDE